jgi:cysteinyl-tRNA synthetase
MAINALGETIDIHGGGQDLIFPHHENEIAQSESATGKQFVRYWIHNGFVTLNREKMSKSLGNFFTLRQIFEKYPPRVVRYYLMTQHYKSPLDFSDENLGHAKNALDGLDDVFKKLAAVPEPFELPAKMHNLEPELLTEYTDKFKAFLDDDFNTERALSVMHQLKKDALRKIQSKDYPWLRKAYFTLSFLMRDYLGVALPENTEADNAVVIMKEDRERARKEKNWQLADEYRKKLDQLGYKVEDNPDGTSTLIRRSR